MLKFLRDPLITMANHFWASVMVFGGSVLLGALAFSYAEGIEFWYDSIYWAITTATTVGFGDVTPKTDHGKQIANVLMFVGIISWAFVIVHMNDRLREDRKANETLCELQAIIDHFNIKVDYSKEGTK